MTTISDILKGDTKTLLDVRSPQEFASHHIKGAINIPLQEVKDKMEEIRSMPQPIVVYCLSGGRSALAAGLLQQAGIGEVYNGGGIGTMQTMM